MDIHRSHSSRQTQMGAEPLPFKQHNALAVQRRGEPWGRAVRQPLPSTAVSVETAGRAPVGSCLRTSPHHRKAPFPPLWVNGSEPGCSIPGDSR